MRATLKNILGISGSWIPLRVIRRISGFRDIFPFYHAVSDDDLPHVKYFYRIKTVKQFIKDLDFYLSKYEAVSASDWFSHAVGRKRLLKPSMVLSFDDGLREVHDIIAPLLTEKGIPAIFFINPEFIDNKRLFFKYKAGLVIDRLEKHSYPSSLLEVAGSRLGPSFGSKKLLRKTLLNLDQEDEELIREMAELVEVDFETFLKIRKPYMSLEQVRKLRDQGFEIGSHSMDHPLFSSLSLDVQIGQVDESFRWIREKLDIEDRYFSFPFTDEGIGSPFFKRIFRDDQPMVDMSFGTAGIKRDPVMFHFQRIPMDETKTSARIFLKGEYLYCLLKAMLGRNVIRRT